MMDRKRAVKWWRDYFEEISNVEFEHPAVPFASPVYGLVKKVTVSGTEAALRKMKLGKATGPDDLPADLWKSKGCWPVDWLTEFSIRLLLRRKCLRVGSKARLFLLGRCKTSRVLHCSYELVIYLQPMSSSIPTAKLK